ALRAGAARAAELAGGGLALIFAYGSHTGTPVGPPALRAAAGFQTANDARIAAAAVEPLVRDALETLRPQAGMPEVSLGDRARAGLRLWPLVVGERAHGVLVAGLPAEPSEAALDGVAGLVDDLAVRLDHGVLAARLAALERAVEEKGRAAEEKSDEILKLSEALFAQDIELLRNSEKLGKVEKLKADFIEKMSRELRTPLNLIIESIISVLAGENESLSETAKQSLRQALDDGTGFLRTLQNILDLWRIKQGELPVEAQEVNFREVVEEAIFSVQDALGNKPVTIEKRLEEPLPKIRTDLAKINQVLFLLLENAAKFTPEGRIEIHAGVKDGRLRCAIEDTGIGICPDDQQFVFEEFFQVDETAGSGYRGSGLGLTLVRDLLALLDGEIALQSEIGQGTRVQFEVPVQALG
ncbi:MAG: HAMP domain-containing sensor histidine kinase, partial [Myxococcota bacterium]|nr:HAMP domain-containing sensor histidine kinase [Myxococcota bacterium]